MCIKNRVEPYGFGNTFIKINMDELPSDIREGLIKRYENSPDSKEKITKDTKMIIMCCEAIGAIEE